MYHLLSILLTFQIVVGGDLCFDMGNYYCYNSQCLSFELSTSSYDCRGSGHNIPARCPENAICTDDRYTCRPGYRSVWNNPGQWGNYCNNCKLDHSCVSIETGSPTPRPTNSPTPRPTNSPTQIPTQMPTAIPTLNPTSIDVSIPAIEEKEEKEEKESFFNVYVIPILVVILLIILVIYRLISQCIEKCVHEDTLPITAVASVPPTITNVSVYQGAEIPTHLPNVDAEEIIPSAPPMMDKV